MKPQPTDDDTAILAAQRAVIDASYRAFMALAELRKPADTKPESAAEPT